MLGPTLALLQGKPRPGPTMKQPEPLALLGLTIRYGKGKELFNYGTALQATVRVGSGDTCRMWAVGL